MKLMIRLVNYLRKWGKKIPTYFIVTFMFLFLILLGAILLWCPFSVRDGVELSFLDALFTATSAVCVTGLTVVDTAGTFTLAGRIIIMSLIQLGGLGIAFVSASLFLLFGARLGFKSRELLKESLNTQNTKGLVTLFKQIIKITFLIEILGAVVSFITFVRDYRVPKAIELSIFHAVSSFCNAGFDILGGLENYRTDALFNINTMLLIILGGIGFLTITDIKQSRNFKKLRLQSKIVILTSAALIVVGAAILHCSEDISWLEAAFHSVSARTAGFATNNLGEYSAAGNFAIIMLMFVGASPGSTGGGIKTSTFFVMVVGIWDFLREKPIQIFRRRISDQVARKAMVLSTISSMVVITGTMLLTIMEPSYTFMQILFEVASAFSTAGLSTGITSALGTSARMLLIILMFIGRVGILTILAGVEGNTNRQALYTEEYVSIG